MYTPAIFALALAAAVNAITVESPTRDSVWQSGTSSQTVSWKAVSTDAESFAILLVNQAGFLDNSPVTLVQNQSTGASDQVNSVTVSYPSGNWPVGTAFQINLVTSTSSNSAILAQSNQFNITSGGSSSGSTASSSSATTGTAPTTVQRSPMASSTIPAVTDGSGNAAGAAASSGTGSSNALPNAVTSNAALGEVGKPGVVGALLVGAAALIGVTF